jgi:hypothetical protein
MYLVCHFVVVNYKECHQQKDAIEKWVLVKAKLKEEHTYSRLSESAKDHYKKERD